MSEPLAFVLCFHSHQPVGNFPEVFAEAYARAYEPLLQALEAHPGTRVALHYSGPLLEWFEAEHPEFLDRLAERVTAGQVEVLGGGFYEPILAILPEADARGQLAYMRAWLQRRLGARARGMWLAERAWEPALPGLVGPVGIEYTLVDESHLAACGLPRERIRDAYLTDDRGQALVLFPIDHALRYMIPFKEPGAIIERLRGLRALGAQAVTFGDDGEKLGVWPGTYEWVWKKGWLERFFGALEAVRDEIALRHPSELVDEGIAAERVYLPTASYDEMMEWVLPPGAQIELLAFKDELEEADRLEAVAPFVKGGFWRNFFARYPEAHWLCRRMWLANARVREALGPRAMDTEHPPEALRSLWRGQTNDPYWHGIFGGIYLNALRFAAYRNLIEAEVLANDAGKESPGAVEKDVDLDLRQEVLLSDRVLEAFVAPAQGGALIELDVKSIRANILATLARRPEAYHRALRDAEVDAVTGDGTRSIHEGLRVKEAGLGAHLIYDNEPRFSLLDRFLPPGATLAAWVCGEVRDGGDFAGAVYRAALELDAAVRLSRSGHAADGQRVEVEKHLALGPEPGILTARYELAGAGAHRFSVELNFGFLTGTAADRYYIFPDRELTDPLLGSTGEEREVESLALVDEWMGVEARLHFAPPAVVWRFPIETVSQSEAGVERTYQGSAVLPHWDVALDGAPWRMTLTMEIRTR